MRNISILLFDHFYLVTTLIYLKDVCELMIFMLPMLAFPITVYESLIYLLYLLLFLFQVLLRLLQNFGQFFTIFSPRFNILLQY